MLRGKIRQAPEWRIVNGIPKRVMVPVDNQKAKARDKGRRIAGGK